MNQKIPDDQWFQAVMIYEGPDEGAPHLHVSGEVKYLKETEGTRSRESSGHVVIGRRYVEEDDRYCTTMVDDLMLWSRSLTTNEVENFMAMY